MGGCDFGIAHGRCATSRSLSKALALGKDERPEHECEPHDQGHDGCPRVTGLRRSEDEGQTHERYTEHEQLPLDMGSCDIGRVSPQPQNCRHIPAIERIRTLGARRGGKLAPHSMKRMTLPRSPR